MNSLQVVHGQLGVDQQGQRLHGGARDRREVFQRGVGQLAVQRGVDHHHAGVGQHQGVAVGRGFHHVLRAHGAAGAGLVVDHDGLAQHGLQAFGQQAGMLVQRAAGRKADHDADGLFGESCHGCWKRPEP
jgi:hypothetical protein